MSPRRARRMDPYNRGRRGAPATRPTEGFPGGMDRVEDWPDGEWRVRRLNGAAADKTYRCPGCDQEIGSGLPHIVSWPNWTGGRGRAAALAHGVLAQASRPRPRP